ncbi:MAG: hypothetical protein AAFR02_11010 [Pseudomonadota bacterium]
MALTTIYAGLEIERALVLRSLLEAHRIPCFLHHDHHAGADPVLQFAFGGTRRDTGYNRKRRYWLYYATGTLVLSIAVAFNF